MKIKSKRVYVAGDFMPAVISFHDTTIDAIEPYDNEADEDFGDLMILPGFIDIHCHGAYGFDTNYAELRL